MVVASETGASAQPPSRTPRAASSPAHSSTVSPTSRPPSSDGLTPSSMQMKSAYFTTRSFPSVHGAERIALRSHRRRLLRCSAGGAAFAPHSTLRSRTRSGELAAPVGRPGPLAGLLTEATWGSSPTLGSLDLAPTPHLKAHPQARAACGAPTSSTSAPHSPSPRGALAGQPLFVGNADRPGASPFFSTAQWTLRSRTRSGDDAAPAGRPGPRWIASDLNTRPPQPATESGSPSTGPMSAYSADRRTAHAARRGKGPNGPAVWAGLASWFKRWAVVRT